MSSKFARVFVRTVAVVGVAAAVGITIGAANMIESEAAARPQVKAAPSPSPSQQPTPPPSTPATHPAAGGKVVYFTFDDGPDPAWTPQILDILARNNAKATFFELGQLADRHPELHDAVLAAGHAIGSHSYSHPQLTKVSAVKRHREITGGPASKCFRPPYGAENTQVKAEIKAAGMKPVLWDVDSLDWTKPGVDAIVANVLTTVHSGSVVLMHDAGGNRSQTVAALEKVLPILAAKGYTFAALDC
ncbi:peptidoglycan/xylan/chitin deacetylase (PgdA/CDA1 family) [Kribbella voronezhensis]|uniref:Peptidoglycan/xylan/chitin deacetylase (PgdA/CDA1 family) n=1 Tax=Kribbella voronezhensis TaxID=2512212 RepID=A0A4R7T4J1_9ACTN|nr:polysaccharide deacetylase family protein [Kribbella voronezhensis]TDU86525.1 peptidoglycan/xylan/chitin deacetylase (PgdA/CDA1 family) [Kribbella voronezhensis]